MERAVMDILEAYALELMDVFEDVDWDAIIIHVDRDGYNVIAIEGDEVVADQTGVVDGA